MPHAERSGLILHTEHYEACVGFYRDTVGLRIEFQKDEPDQVLTIFEFGTAYLMLERGGVASKHCKTARENPVTLRLNVVDIAEAADRLRRFGVEVNIERFDWGATANFFDPDGNRCQLREAASFGR